MHIKKETGRAGIRGFTLIELSIVLVIIGMLVGVIVGGQSLLHQAALRAVIRDLQSYQTAVNTFRNQYDASPGDFSTASTFWAGATNGSGDMRIGCTNVSSAANMAANCIEPVLAWRQLSLSTIVPSNYSGVAGAGTAASPFFVPRTNIPASKIMDGAGYVIYYDDATYLNSYNAHVILLGASLTTGLGFTRSVISPVDARTLDEKIDDRQRDTGKLRAITGGSPTGACNGGTAATSGNYDLTNITNACILYWLLD